MNRVLGIRDIYNVFKSENKADKTSYKVIVSIIDDYINFLVDKLLEGESVQLPERLGTFEFTGQKVHPKVDENGNIKGLAPDWKSTNELWVRCPECKEKKEIIFFFNEHTQGLRYKLRWSKKRVFVNNSEYYAFKLTSVNRKRFKDKVMAGKEYYEKPYK